MRVEAAAIEVAIAIPDEPFDAGELLTFDGKPVCYGELADGD